jgi:signal peptidase I
VHHTGHSRYRHRLVAFGKWILPALLAVVVILPLRSAVADWNDVPSGSMRPTILEGDRIFVDKLAYGLRIPFTKTWLREGAPPARGDIITFASPKDGTRLVKRIAGIPGDRISMAGNHLTVNGEPVEYEKLAETQSSGRGLHVMIAREALPGRHHEVAFTQGVFSRNSFDEIVVPGDEYFFLGDNRDQSFDSRYMGSVRRQHIYGRVTHIALSVDPERSYSPRFERWFTPVR